MKNRWINSDTDSLFKAILALKNIDEARCFFRDLLTQVEILEFSNRWKAAKMLSKKQRYTLIEKETGLSSTTVARVSKWLNYGMNGYKLVLRRLDSSTHHDLAPAG